MPKRDIHGDTKIIQRRRSKKTRRVSQKQRRRAERQRTRRHEVAEALTSETDQ